MKRNLFAVLFVTIFLIHCVQKERKPAASNQRSPTQSSQSVTTSTNPVAAGVTNLNVEDWPFEVCSNDKKNYLEKQIQAKVAPNYLTVNNNDWDKSIPLKCIQFAQKNFRGSFAYCDNQDDRPLTTAPKPCLTENYSRLVYNAFHDVKNCFNLDPRRSFLQIMIESGFHLNAINKTGFDAGISQFTKNGILRVMDKGLLQKTREQLLMTSSRSCQRIANVFDDLEKDSFDINKRCSMIALPQNPYRALVLHYLHTLKDQIYFKNEFLSSRPELAAVVTPQILEQFVYMAYNRGLNGTLKIIDGYVKSRKAMGQVISENDMDLFQNLSAARKILKNEPEKREILKRARIKKLTLAEYAIIHDKSYVATMAEARDYVKSILGDACF